MKKFSFPPEVSEAFTFGDCWALACEVEFASGFPVTVLLHSDKEEDNRYWFHVGNRLPDGTITDIEGIHTEDEWIARWAGESESGAPVIAQWKREEMLENVEPDEFDGEPILVYPEVDSREWAKQILTLIA